MNLNRALRVVTVHVCSPRTLVIVIATPFLKGSTFEDGMVMMMCEGTAMEGINCTLLLMMWMLGSNALLACIIKLLHLRNPESAVVTAASNLSLLNRFEWV